MEIPPQFAGAVRYVIPMRGRYRGTDRLTRSALFLYHLGQFPEVMQTKQADKVTSGDGVSLAPVEQIGDSHTTAPILVVRTQQGLSFSIASFRLWHAQRHEA